jgi:uncharacterized protein
MAQGKEEPPRAWQRMLSGRRLDLLDPSPLDIEIEDIAHGLSRVARWNGQTLGVQAFSVAQHSVLVEAIAGRLEGSLLRSQLLFVLLHDAAEFVIGDLISPFKAMLSEDYRDVEQRLMKAVSLRFGIAKVSADLQKLTKKADRLAAYHEATQLAGFSEKDAVAIFGAAPKLPVDLALLLEPLTPVEAKKRFLARFSVLFEVDAA